MSPFSAGVVTLLSDYEVCKEGDVLTPEQARVLVSPALPAVCSPGGIPQRLLITLVPPHSWFFCRRLAEAFRI